MIRFPHAITAATVAALLSGLSLPAVAQTPPGEIKGQDVTGDKGRSAQDGWVQAPIPREESAGKDASNPGGSSTKQNADRPVPASDPASAPGGDPQTPLDHRTPGPSGANPASPSK